MSDSFQMPNHRQRVVVPGGKNQPPQAQSVTVPAIAVMVKGLKAMAHVNKFMEKKSKYPLDVGFDLFPSTGDHEVAVYGGWTVIKISTLINMAIVPPAHMGFIHARSSSVKTLYGGEIITGIIDPHYTGDIIVSVRCLTADAGEVMKAIKAAADGEVAIAQIIFIPTVEPALAEWNEKIAATFKRGVQGFGSSDVPPAPTAG